MGRPSSPSPHQAIVLAFVLAGLVPHAAAQTAPPRPTFDQQQLPALYFNVWPADFNEDGVSDLVAGTRVLGERGDVVVAIGRGNGTFLDPVTVAFRAVPLVPADFNADGFIDLVILGDVTLEVLPGNGDATFDTAILIDENHQVPELRVWAHAADMNGDGRRDLIVPDRRDDGFVLLLYPGTGALTFEAPIVLPTLNDLPGVEITSGDFNGDGRRDFAVVDLCCTTVFINQGGYTFTPATVGGAFNDIVTNDLNGDGRLDLVVVAGNYWRFDPNTRLGEVSILFGNGNGTFQPPVRYPLNVHGTMSVVVGDFNGDSRLDVAAGSRSGVFIPDLGRVLSDSVSVLPGDGTGRLLAPVTYALAYIRQGDFGVGFTDSPYWTAHHQLNTSDLDGDRRTDLIASPGVTLLNRAPRSNRPPTAFAGPDRGSFQAEQRVFLGAEASNPDMDWLTYVWTDGSGRVISNWPATGAVLLGGATETYTLTVSDGRGGTASDTVTMRNQNPQSDPWLGFERPVPGENIQSGVPYILQFGVFRVELLTSLEVSSSLDDGRTFTTVPGCGGLPPTATSCTWSNPGPLTDNLRLRLTAVGPATGTWVLVSGRHAITALPPLPGGWSSTDIGAVGAAGTASFANGTWTIEGSGADIWANADELRYAYLAAGFVGAKDFTFTARVVGIENLHRWVKAGIMVREDLSPGARHVSLFATPSTERGLAFQRRLTPGGTSIHTAGPAIAPPMWLRVGRAGDVVSAYYRLSPTEPSDPHRPGDAPQPAGLGVRRPRRQQPRGRRAGNRHVRQRGHRANPSDRPNRGCGRRRPSRKHLVRRRRLRAARGRSGYLGYGGCLPLRLQLRHRLGPGLDPVDRRPRAQRPKHPSLGEGRRDVPGVRRQPPLNRARRQARDGGRHTRHGRGDAVSGRGRRAQPAGRGSRRHRAVVRVAHEEQQYVYRLGVRGRVDVDSARRGHATGHVRPTGAGRHESQQCDDGRRDVRQSAAGSVLEREERLSTPNHQLPTAKGA